MKLARVVEVLILKAIQEPLKMFNFVLLKFQKF